MCPGGVVDDVIRCLFGEEESQQKVDDRCSLGSKEDAFGAVLVVRAAETESLSAWLSPGLHAHAPLLPRGLWGFLPLLQNMRSYAGDLGASFYLTFLVQDVPLGVTCQNYKLQLTVRICHCCLAHADPSLGVKETVLRSPSLRLSEVTCSDRFIIRFVIFNITANFHLLGEVFLKNLQLSSLKIIFLERRSDQLELSRR